VADVAQIDAKLAKRIAGIIRMFTSDNPGDVAAATKALGRTLQGVNADVLFVVAERIEHPNERNDDDLQKLVDFGRELERKDIERERRRRYQAAHAPPQMPPAADMAMFCLRNVGKLNEWETTFITNIAAITRTSARPLTPKRQAHLEKIYLGLGGGFA
jgi:hypothetical protein